MKLMVVAMLVISLIIGIVLAFLITLIIQKKVGGDPFEIELLANEVAKVNFNIEIKEGEKTSILKAFGRGGLFLIILLFD